ncbi:NAD(P)H-dependent flavin oxidoreductase [Bacillus sp. FJAT-27986]|uniref:NAD(P)H-dependent flavin oxidoreductase n=1 Tax=Bacillus sp. FJAT-27986 TaxID=1743146 RepID=UPI00080AF437|nr:nitronate monooxygenase [Bacillus sp. FJAT-27986]OCA86956.1 nitronate monooxygenase [Bacillus sp. FJAT-27986]
MENKLIQELGIKYPILQAPMAGVTTPELVSSVSNNNCLGSIGAGYLTADKTREFIHNVKKLTKHPFGINLFVPENHELIEDKILKTNSLLDQYRKELQIVKDDLSISTKSEFDEQIEIVLKEKLKVCSFTFGIPSKEIVKELKKIGTVVIGTATNVKEAQIVESIGMDAVVVQGSEAGGHRGSFMNPDSLIGLMSLIPQVVDNVSIPVIAAGGIMDGRGVTAALCLGAKAVQLGTAFLTTKESGAHPLHKKAILNASEEDVLLTRVFSGKTARGVNNKFMENMREYENELPAYPYQNTLTKEIRRVAIEQNNKEYMSLWSGQSPRLSREVSVKELIQSLQEESKGILNQFVNL